MSIGSMRAVAVLTREAQSQALDNPTLSSFSLHGTLVHIAMLAVAAPHFEHNGEGFRNKVLVRVKAFSCNYRDQSMIMAVSAREHPGFYVLGSEFSGEIVDVGADVTLFATGDRVIPNCAYYGRSAKQGGVVSNHSSAEYLVLRDDQLVRMPPTMDWITGAAFTIGAQTVFSMLRKLSLKYGSRVLVTAARSSTSLFAIAAAAARGARVYALTTSAMDEARLLSFGASAVIRVDPAEANLSTSEPFREWLQDHGGFDAVIDPFFDLYLAKTIPLLVPGGKYITCGLEEQFRADRELGHDSDGRYRNALISAMTNNVSLICNCLGLTNDLSEALLAYETGLLPTVVSGSFRGTNVGAFIESTFSRDTTCGKTVFAYDEA